MPGNPNQAETPASDNQPRLNVDPPPSLTLSSNKPTSREPFFRRHRSLTLIGIIFLGLVLYALLTGFEREVFRIKWKGEPVTLQECRTYLNLPTDEGQGDLWKAAISFVKQSYAIVYNPPIREDYLNLPFVGVGDPPRDANRWYADLPIAIDFLNHFTKAIHLVHQASDARQSIPFSTKYERYPVHDWATGMMSIHRLIRLETITLLADRRLDDAVESVERLVRVEECYMANRSLISFLVQVSWRKEFGNLLAYLLSDRDLTSQHWQRIQSSRVPFSSQEMLVTSLIVDRANYIEFERSESLLSDPLAYDRITYRTQELQYCTALINAARTDWHVLLTSLRSDKKMTDLETRPRVFAMQAVTAEAHQRLHLAAIASRRFIIDRQRLPQSIDELIPDYLDKAPLFPASNDRMVMEQTDKGELLFHFPVQYPDRLRDVPIPRFSYQAIPHDQED
jgi:hypothetical protein